MGTLNLRKTQDFSLDVTVRESDEYSKEVYVRFEHTHDLKEIRGAHEMFMTPDQLELLGRYLCRQAEEIRGMQKYRETI